MSEQLVDLVGLPKAELHLHLEGAMRPGTVLDLARENGVDFPYANLAELNSALAFDDFLKFLELFGVVNRCLVKRDDFERITRELIDDLVAEGTVYAEIRYAPMHPMLRGGMTFDEVTAGVVAGAEAGMRAHPGFHVELISGLTRQMGLELCSDCAKQSADWLGRGVAAIDIGGDEVGMPAERFEEIYRLARSAGLGVTAHAGEAAGPESVWNAINRLGVRRVGHGFRSIEDAGLVTFLKEEGITLEICPTSNIRTKVVPSYDVHPLRRLFDAGVNVTISSDDPAMFQSSIGYEYEVAVREFGFSQAELLDLTRNAIEAGFCSADVKRRLLAGL